MSRMKKIVAICSFPLLVAPIVLAQEEVRPMPPVAEVTIDYDTHIKPILQNSCLECHNETKKKSKLRLDTRDLVLQGGIEGPSVIIGDSANSNMIKILLGAMEDYEIMPPADGEIPPLTDEEIGLLRAWIDQGLEWGADTAHPSEAAVVGLPEDWKAQATKQGGPLADWGLLSDAKGPNGEQLIALTAHETPVADTLNLLWTPKANFTEGQLSVQVKANGGAKLAGIAARIQDNGNYVAALVDTPAGILKVLQVKNGEITTIAETAIAGDAPEWANLTLNIQGDTVGATLGESKVSGVCAIPASVGAGYITQGDTTAAFTAFKKQ